MSIRIGIYGYGNLGRGVESAIAQNDDMELVAVFTRRPPETLKIRTAGVPVVSADDAKKMKDDIDVMIICGGSATDLPTQTPALASLIRTRRYPSILSALTLRQRQAKTSLSFLAAGTPVCSR